MALTSSDLLDSFRNEMFDTAEPYLWSDTEAFQFMDEAQTMFCRKTHGISDARTATVTQLAIVPNVEWYPTDASILNIRKITRADTGRKVEMLTLEQADARGIVFASTLKGVVRYVVLGYEPHAVRIAPMPTETVMLNMLVWRLPLVTITDFGGQAFEIDQQHVLNLMLWMKHRAYNKQDAETYDRRKSDEYKARFEAYCAEAKVEQERARRVLGNVVYGGIGSTYSSIEGDYRR